MQRPTGVTILAIALFLGIPYLLFLTLVLLGAKFSIGYPIFFINFLSYFVDWPSFALLVLFLKFTANGTVIVGFYCVLMLIYLTVGGGLLRLQNWARLVVIILAILNFFTSVGGYVGPRLILFRQSPIGMVLEVVVLIYLFRPGVKKAFGTTGP